jgi:hypothetical protein
MSTAFMNVRLAGMLLKQTIAGSRRGGERVSSSWHGFYHLAILVGY